MDQAAHAAALDAGGTTTAVLAEGLASFEDRFSDGGVDSDSWLLASSLPPDVAWSKFHAMDRNRTIAALADAVVVVAAGTSGGSWEQGVTCLKAGKRLLVPDFDPDIAPCNRRLIAKGAAPFDPEHPEAVLSLIAAKDGAPQQLGLLGR